LLVHRIRIENFLSYDSLTWDAIDSRLNMIVGPNGAGKTNLFNAIKAVRDVVALRNLELWQEASHAGPANPAYRIEADVEWNDAWEQEVLMAFLGAALADDRSMQTTLGGMSTTDGWRRFSELVLKQLPTDWASLLFRGRIIVRYEGMSRWRTSYMCLGADAPCELALESGWSVLTAGDQQAATLTQIALFQRWYQSLEPLRQKEVVDHIRESTSEPTLVFPNWSELVRGHSIVFDVAQPWGFMPTHQRFEQASGLSLTTSAQGARPVLRKLLDVQIILTENVRRLPRRVFSTDTLKEVRVSFEDGELLALHLLLLEKGTKPEPERYRRVTQIFDTLTKRSFEVRIAAPEGGQPNEVLYAIWTLEDGKPIPLEFSGAGIGEALLLSAAIAADGKTVFLDEPALNLHPHVQTRLARELLRHDKVQFFVTTHSQVLVTAEVITTTSRFYKKNQATQRVSLDQSGLDKKQLATLQKELRRSSDARGLLFSSGVILVEGETELGALPLWFEKRFGEWLEEFEITFYSVGGDPGFGTFVKFLKEFAVPLAIFCDRPVIYDKNPSRISRQLRAAGIDALDDTSLDEAGRASMLAEYGVFCPLDSSQKEFDDLELIRNHRDEAYAEVGSSKVRIGRFIAENYDCPEAVAAILERTKNYLLAELR
jgi:hypothetical protein